MAYLYECKYKRIKISLITRHSDTFNELLKDSFKKLSISRELFDEVLEIGWNTKKKEVMTDINDAIFIDNSFDERKDIYETFNIPVFDVTNIDCLFDWRF